MRVALTGRYNLGCHHKITDRRSQKPSRAKSVQGQLRETSAAGQSFALSRSPGLALFPPSPRAPSANASLQNTPTKVIERENGCLSALRDSGKIDEDLGEAYHVRGHVLN
jgi:hypothetical protein